MSCHRNLGTGPDLQTDVVNWSQQVVVHPRHLFSPTSIDELVAIVNAAEAESTRVRAIGSAWSFTNIIDTPDYLVLIGALNSVLSETMSSNPSNNPGPSHPVYDDPVFGAFTKYAKGRNLVHVQAGIRIHDLANWLDDYSSNHLPPGSHANDGDHGWALPTMGGSGGQTIVGAISTSTHGGDLGIPPLPDMVRAIYLIGPGGKEWWIEPTGQAGTQIVDAVALAESVPCVAGRIVFNDDVFNSVLVACGRMGIIYSIVIEVKGQFYLQEMRAKAAWNQLRSSGDLDSLRKFKENHFLQVLILPYDNGNGDHDCYVTKRTLLLPEQYNGPKNAPGFDLFNFACAHPILNPFLTPFVLALGAAALAVLGIPFYGLWLNLQINAVISNVTLILNFGGSLGQALAALVDGVAGVDFPGFTDIAASAINGVLSSQQPDETGDNVREDLSFKIMDTYQYDAACYKAVSMEVAFDADDTKYIDFVDAVFGIINQLKGNRQMVGAYISLRYCGSSRAFLAIEQWKNTVCIEIAGLKDLRNDPQALGMMEAEAARRGATVHWGQINNRDFNDTANTYPKIENWRGALKFIIDGGSPRTFDNDFCFQRGLETTIPAPILSGKTTLPDTSDGVPVLAAHSRLLFLAWKGSGNANLNVEFSSDAGQNFGGKHVSSETSDAPPALVAHNGNLMIAWKGSGNGNLNVSKVVMGEDSTGNPVINQIATPVTLSETSDTSPTLASHNGVLFLAWKGSGNSNINVNYSFDNGATFIDNFVSGQTTDTPPALASHNGSLMVAWRGSGNDNLNVATVDLLVTSNNTILGIRGFRDVVTLSDTSSHAPGLASVRKVLYLGWKGSGNDNLNVMVSQDNGKTFFHKNTSPETSDDGPGLAWFNDRSYVSWKGSGNDNINVARANLSGTVDDVLLARSSGRLIQSSFGIPGNFETVALVAEDDRTSLVHYYYDNSNLLDIWHPTQVITFNATSPASLFQSNFGFPDYPGNFELVVLESNELVHSFRNNADVTSPWQRGLVVSRNATGPGSIIQTSFGTPSAPGNLEVVVLEGSNLQHYYYDSLNPSAGWQPGQIITIHATGAGSITQSNFGIDNNLDIPGNFEVVVLEGSNLVHYRHDNSDPGLPWSQGKVISRVATGLGTMIQSTFGSPQNFEAVVLEGNNLRHYFLDNSKPNSEWQPTKVITPYATGPGSIIQSNFGLPNLPGNFEVVVLEGQNLVHYYRDNSDVNNDWKRVRTISSSAIG